jgi:major membrane immunogen (membrane-anchored lipoprotein)
MKRILFLMLTIVMMLSLFVGCSNDKTEDTSDNTEPQDTVDTDEATDADDTTDADANADEATYADGVYYARDEISDSWTYFVIVTVKGGKITDAYWGGTNFVPQGDKRILSENGEYGMVAYGGAQSYWYEQAEAAEAWLIENQDPTAFEDLYTDEEGHTDALTTDGGASVSIHVVEFFTLAEQALASDPIPAGEYGDTPVVTAKGEPSDNGWQELAEFIVVNGTIVAVDFDALYSKELITEGDDANAQYFVVDGDKATPQSKDQLKEAYGMSAAGSELEWYQQAELLEQYVLENQTIYPVTDDGYADGVTGVSIHANGFQELFNEAFGK